MLNKQQVPINFSQGLDTKTDKKQVQVGKFLSLQNSIFDTAGRLTKRNGFGPLASTTGTFLTTFNGNLTAIGSSLQAYSSGSNTWVTKGPIQPVEFSTLPLIRSNLNQSQVDSAVSGNGLVCTVYTDNTTTYKYVIADLVTGQNIIPPTLIPPTTGAVTGSPRVFLLGRYFIIVFTNVISATSHLQYVAISTNDPTMITTPVDIASSYISATTLSWDGVVANEKLYIAYNTTTGGQSIKVTYLTQTLTVVTAVTFATRIATIMSLTADITTPSSPIIYASFYDSAGSTGYTLAVDQNLNTILAPTQIISTGSVSNITSVANAGICQLYYETPNAYSYDGAIATNYINKNTITQSGTVGTASVLKRSLGLASKAFIIDDVTYMLGLYYSVNQPTYFLIDSSGNIISQFANGNSGPYYTLGLPNVSVSGMTAYIPYLIKDAVQSVNKTQGAAVSATVYAQTGLNLATLIIGSSSLSTAEIANNLHFSGGFLWAYDGYLPVEQAFFLYPDNVEVTGSGTGGVILAQQYYYAVTYEWSDNQGNLFRSSPSIPVTVTTTGSTSSVTVNVPTLRLTYKTANPVKIVIYRWSTANQVYYQVTSIASPTLNSTTTDSIAYVDTLADASIIGNNILYTTGGVLENIAAPPTNVITLFDNRLFLVDAEDPNLLWYSKQVLNATPVEMSDLLTIYVAPTTSAHGSTGPTKAAAPLDDKLILFKKDAIYYINGKGPDNTGANSQYSDATFITSTVGSDNQRSIVFMPNGLMFQSDKGIWLLGRDLNTSYIGAPVEYYTTNARVLSAEAIPGTNQVRFIMDSGITLMFDYYYNQWATFINIPSVSSTLYQNLHTYINSDGEVFQETPGLYLDNTSPVLMSFTTSWINLAGVQGYERLYQMLLLGEYITPFKLSIGLSYDYNEGVVQNTVVSPDNYTPTYGGEALYGSGLPYGGASSVFESRVFPEIQKCESFRVSVTESYDSTFGVAPGAGLTLSGLNLTIGLKKGTRVSSASRSFG